MTTADESNLYRHVGVPELCPVCGGRNWLYGDPPSPDVARKIVWCACRESRTPVPILRSDDV